MPCRTSDRVINNLLVEHPHAEQVSGVSRVETRVGGTGVWFESADTALKPSAEGVAGAFLIPALAMRRRLVVESALAVDWVENSRQVLDTARRWWRYPRMWPEFHIRPVAIAPQAPRVRALCFTGGVDSFFTLLHSGWSTDVLVFVHGYDVPLEDESRAGRIRSDLHRIARAVGARAVTIRTNLRSHPAFRNVSWERTHGGALAAIGHLLGGLVDGLVISSSTPYSNDHPWGSHWELDPYWGGAGLTIEHIGAEFTRNAKLRMMADSELVRQHLRVCWENRDHRLNCSRCEKCIRTRIVLSRLGVLDAFPVFDGPATLAADLDRLPALENLDLFPRYEEEIGSAQPEAVSRAIEAFLRRTRRQRWRRRISRLAGPIRRVAGRRWRSGSRRAPSLEWS